MAELPASMMKRKKSGIRYAWLLLAAGGAIVVYSLLRTDEQGIPGWQPAGEMLRAAMDAHEAPSPAAPVSSAADRLPSPVPADPVREQPPKSAGAGLLDLNRATEAELEALPGIGPSKVQSILAYRVSHQGFRSPDELLQVRGIGPKLYEKLRPLVTAVPPASAP